MGEPVHKHRQTKAIINRLSRIEGHVRSIKSMVEEGRDCAAFAPILARKPHCTMAANGAPLLKPL